MSFVSEEYDSNSKKPRSPRSQGGPVQVDPSRLKIHNLDVVIEPVSIKDYRRVAKTLQMAFDKDPFVNYILNTQVTYDDSPRSRKLIKQKNSLFQSFFEFSVVEYFSYGGVIVVVRDVDFEAKFSKLGNYPFLAAACWNTLQFDNCMSLSYNTTTTNKLLLAQTTVKFNYLAYLNHCRQKSMKEKFPFLNNIRQTVLHNLNMNLSYAQKFNSLWYLSDVGVLPAMAGKSLGKHLINYCLDSFVADSWAYLESSNIINRTFYKKLGFRTANTFAVNEDEILNNIDLDNVDDLNVLNGLDKDFILMDAMFRPPTNLDGISIRSNVSIRSASRADRKDQKLAPAVTTVVPVTPLASPAAPASASPVLVSA